LIGRPHSGSRRAAADYAANLIVETEKAPQPVAALFRQDAACDLDLMIELRVIQHT